MSTQAEIETICDLCGGPHENQHCYLMMQDQPLEKALEKLTMTTMEFVQTTTTFIEEARTNFRNQESAIRNLETQMGQIDEQQEDEEEDEPMPQADGGNFEEEDQQPPQQNQPPQQDQQPQQHGFPNFQPRYESQYHEDLQGIEETLSSMHFFQQTFYENMQKSQADYMEEVKQIKEK
ncbi:hypothetical protein PIB30_075425 [Stylosanthes scabra]|uniref:Uncharacterized protein n=1 Tax=Stylosanthes scabra TaxID=79078 RepID=A0ABU6ZNQ6_9FABA|nr:hypothetical protein [Stylosanthes scabra]